MKSKSPFCRVCTYQNMICTKCGFGFFERSQWNAYSPKEKQFYAGRAREMMTPAPHTSRTTAG